jgi:membrane protease subunit (stomatin/prohibitin family)
MAIVDRIKWDAPDDVYAWKFNSGNPDGRDDLALGSQLIVSESQEAVLLLGGQMDGPFGPGRHTLSTQNIPFISKLINLPFGGKTPFTAEIWYVNRAIPLDVKWGTSDAIQLQDPKYQVMLPVRAFGQFGVQIADTRKFLAKMVGTMPIFTRDKLSSYFRGTILKHAKDMIAKSIVQEGISILEISAHLTSLSSRLQEQIEAELSTYGLRLASFNVYSINTPEDDPAVDRLKQALAKRAEMQILGYTYQQERSFDTMQTAAGNEGSGSSVMTAGMGMGMGVGLGVPMGQAMGGIAQVVQPGAMTTPCASCGTANPAGARFCSGCGGETAGARRNDSIKCDKCDKCGTSAAKGTRFCPGCGDPFLACPSCGADNPQGAAACGQCGKAMPVKCGQCSAEVPAGAKFCPGCGTPSVKTCSGCGQALQPGAKFCPGCGQPC